MSGVDWIDTVQCGFNRPRLFGEGNRLFEKPGRDMLPAHPVNEKVCRPLEKGLYLLWGLPLEKLWAGGDKRIHKPGAVFPCPAPRLFNAALMKW